MHFFVVIVIPLCMLTTKTNKFGYKEFQARVAHNSAKSEKMPDFMSDRVYKNWIQDEETALQMLREHYIIRDEPPLCTICQRDMTQVKQGARGGADRPKIWRCPTHQGMMF